MSDLLLCKDCVHSRLSTVDRIFTLNGLLPLSTLSYKCDKFKHIPPMDHSDLVAGPRKKSVKLAFCELSRLDERECGQNGKHWSPKKQTGANLVKYLKKDDYE